MRLAEFDPQQSNYELRYPHAFALWDSAGEVARGLQAIDSQLTMKEANPAKVLFTAPGKKFEIAVELKRMGISYFGTDMEQFERYAADATRLVVDVLGISAIERVGTRLILSRKTNDIRAAADSIRNLGLLNFADAPYFGHKEGPVAYHLGLRWEDEARGAFVALKTEKSHISFTPPRELSEDVKSLEKNINEVLLDFDYYTTVPIEVAKLSARDWVRSAVQLMRRDSQKLFKLT